MKISIKDYHAREEISKSDLDLFAKSPYHLKHKAQFVLEPSANLLLGSAFHKLSLEPQDFNKEFAIAPNCDRRTKQGREDYEDFIANLGDKTVLSPEIYATAQSMAEALKAHEIYPALFKNGLAEMSYFSQIEGVKVKCRPDFLNEDLGLVIDLKSTTDASESGFAKTMANFNYHIQAAFYLDILQSLGINATRFIFVAVEKSAPYLIGFYELDAQSLELGRSEYLKLLQKYKFYQERGFYPSYESIDELTGAVSFLKQISLPRYKFISN